LHKSQDTRYLKKEKNKLLNIPFYSASFHIAIYKIYGEYLYILHYDNDDENEIMSWM